IAKMVDDASLAGCVCRSERVGRAVEAGQAGEAAADEDGNAPTVGGPGDDSGNGVLLNPDFDIERLRCPKIPPVVLNGVFQGILHALESWLPNMPAGIVRKRAPRNLFQAPPPRQMRAQAFVSLLDLLNKTLPDKPIEQVSNGNLPVLSSEDALNGGEQLGHLLPRPPFCWTSLVNLCLARAHSIRPRLQGRRGRQQSKNAARSAASRLSPPSNSMMAARSSTS